MNDLSGAWQGNLSGTVDLPVADFEGSALVGFSSSLGLTEIDLRAKLTTKYLHLDASVNYNAKACSDNSPITSTGQGELTVFDGKQPTDVLFTVPSAQVSFTRLCSEGGKESWGDVDWAVSGSEISATLGELALTGGDFSVSYNGTTEVWLGDLSSNMALGDGKIPDLQTFWKADFSSKDGLEELDLRAKLTTKHLHFDMSLDYDDAVCADTPIVSTGTGELSVLDGAADKLFTSSNAALVITRCANANNGWSISVSDVTVDLGLLTLTEVDSN